MAKIQKGTVIPLFSADDGNGALEIKLKRELDTLPSVFNQTFREDVCSVLTLSEWDDEVMLCLIQTPNLLEEVALSLHNDDLFSAFFEQRIGTLTLELVKNDSWCIPRKP